MIFQKNEKCPVCDKIFTDNDDIVICPECGTPHHRECYKSLNHCVNSDKHGTDFEYDYSVDNSVEDDVDKNIYYQPSGEASSNSDNGNQNNGEEIPSMPNFMAQLRNDTVYDKSDETIEGKKVGEVAAVIKTNVARFISKFRKGKSVSWNWSAFIFGPYYLFFRRMVVPGIIFLTLSVAIEYVVMGIFIEPYNAYVQFMSSHASTYSELVNFVASNSKEVTSQLNNIKPMFMIIFGVNLALRIIMALFSDKMYKTKVFKILDDVDMKLKNGGSFNQNSIFAMETNLTQDQMKKLYLGKLGGTSMFLPMIALLVLDLISKLIQRL